jgi:hypothetical protein
LKKVEAERLLADYDADPIAALATALRIVLDMPDATWPALVAAAPIDADQRRRLVVADIGSLDQLATELNEHRGLGHQRD